MSVDRKQLNTRFEKEATITTLVISGFVSNENFEKLSYFTQSSIVSVSVDLHKHFTIMDVHFYYLFDNSYEARGILLPVADEITN